MNVPPQESIRVMADPLCSFSVALLQQAGMAEEHARLVAELLVASDLRGVHSHGTRQIPRYVAELRNGTINADPKVRLLHETESTAVLDGDGGHGYFPAYQGAVLAVAKAKQLGLAAVTTRNHGHYGAAGHYTRVCTAADCIGISASAVRHMPGGDVCVWWSTGAAPISLAIPTGDQPPIVLDMGSYFSNLNSQNLPELFAQIPDAFFKFLGIAAFAQVLGAVLAGVYDYPPQELRRYADASQGSFVLALDVTRFVPTEEFKRHVDRFLRGARSMAPFPGCDRAEYPGGIEWHLEQEYGRVGVPLSPEHMASLNRTADALGLGTLEEWTDSRQRPASSRQPACPP